MPLFPFLFGSSKLTDTASSTSILTGSILEYSLSFLSMRDVLKASNVCHSWNRASDSNLVWNTLTRRSQVKYKRLDTIPTDLRIPFDEADWQLSTAPSPAIQRQTWQAFISKFVQRHLPFPRATSRRDRQKQYWAVRKLHEVLDSYIWKPATKPADHDWLASPILRRHFPFEIELCSSGVCENAPEHVAERLQQAQPKALKQLAAFGNIYSLWIDFKVDDNGSWLSQVLSIPTVRQVQYVSALPPCIWSDLNQLKHLATAIPSLKELEFMEAFCSFCRRNVYAVMSSCHRVRSQSSAPSVIPSNLHGFSKVTSVILNNVDQWNRWKCLSDLPELRTLRVLQCQSVDSSLSPDIDSADFANIPHLFGLWKLSELHLQCPHVLHKVSAASWADFLHQLPHLRFLRVNGISFEAFTQGLAKSAKQLPNLKEARWVSESYRVQDFSSKECETYLRLVSDSFDDTMLLQVCVPFNFFVFVNPNFEAESADTRARIVELSALQIPRIKFNYGGGHEGFEEGV